LVSKRRRGSAALGWQRIDRAEVVLSVRVVDGIRLLDGGEADDKIVALLTSDTVFDGTTELSHLPTAIVNRIVHYFGTTA
jgi:inorganic pyrophosphatase